MSSVLTQGGRQKKPKKKKEEEDQCKSLQVGTNAAYEEVEANERDARTAQGDAEFLAQVRRGVRSRQMIDRATDRKKHGITVSINLKQFSDNK